MCRAAVRRAQRGFSLTAEDACFPVWPVICRWSNRPQMRICRQLTFPRPSLPRSALLVQNSSLYPLSLSFLFQKSLSHLTPTLIRHLPHRRSFQRHHRCLPKNRNKRALHHLLFGFTTAIGGNQPQMATGCPTGNFEVNTVPLMPHHHSLPVRPGYSELRIRLTLPLAQTQTRGLFFPGPFRARQHP